MPAADHRRAPAPPDRSPGQRRHRLGPWLRSLLTIAAAATLAAIATAPAAAQQQQQEEEAETIGGTLLHEGEPVPGVTIVVEDAGGQVIEEATTGEDGRWLVELPGPGNYEVTLLPETLPEGVQLREEERGTIQAQVLDNQARVVIFPLGERESTGARILRQVLARTIDGIKLGLLIAMTAIGLSLIFGTTGLINFAHGEMVTFGAIVAWMMNAGEGLAVHLIPAAIVATLAGAALGGGLERGLFRPLRARKVGLFQLLVITIGLSLILRNVLLIWFGGRSRPYANYTIQQQLELGPIGITPRDLTVVLLSIAILVGVATFLRTARIGKAMRAVADNRDLAESSGIDVRRVILIVWIAGGALAAIGGIFLGLVETVNYLMGFRLLLLMFAGVILGGLGTAYGAMVGSLVVGIVTEISVIWFSPELKFMWALIILIVVLLFRPQGILGRRERIG